MKERLEGMIRGELVLGMVLGAFLVGVLLQPACAASASPGDRPVVGGAGAVVRRVRFEEDRVTCYVVSVNGVSCLRDQP